ncbi:MAG: outer membrane protein assembly factor BamA, partial [Candidatus Omnitrophica bacterium]|nr:outer membrane protein assembly factor BamA [Candidatus Omnitrophota bacterium]
MRKKVFIAGSVFLLISLSLFAQEESSKIITAIEVKGNKSISTNTILSKIKTRVGATFQEGVLNEDLKRLYLLGYFSDIKINTEDYKEGIRVIIEVVEKPVIEKISFLGFRSLRMKEDKLKETISSKENQHLDYPTLNQDLENLRKLYAKKGFTEVKLTYNTELDPSTNKAKVIFSAEEGIRTKIKKIAFEGNSSFSSRRLLKLMKTRPAWLFNPGILKEDVLEEDIKRIKSFYERQGYMDIEVEHKISPFSIKRPNLLLIKINIKEGKRYFVGTVTIKGNRDIPEKDILSRIEECVPGKVFSHEAMKEDVNSILGLYFDRGYIMAQIHETTALNPTTQRIDIVYNIIENEVAYVERIKIRGNVKTKDIVIRRELRVRPGDKFDGDKLRRSKERLQNLGFFEEIDYDIEDTEVTNRKNLVVEVKEAKTGAISFGGGYSTVDDFVGFIEIEQKNFDWKNFPYFTGDGQELS